MSSVTASPVKNDFPAKISGSRAHCLVFFSQAAMPSLTFGRFPRLHGTARPSPLSSLNIDPKCVVRKDGRVLVGPLNDDEIGAIHAVFDTKFPKLVLGRESVNIQMVNRGSGFISLPECKCRTGHLFAEFRPRPSPDLARNRSYLLRVCRIIPERGATELHATTRASLSVSSGVAVVVNQVSCLDIVNPAAPSSRLAIHTVCRRRTVASMLVTTWITIHE